MRSNSSLYVWNHVDPDGNRRLRFFFTNSRALSHGDEADARRELSRLSEVLHISLESNYWSVRWYGKSSVELLARIRNIFAAFQGWTAEQTVKVQIVEISSTDEYRAMVKRHSRIDWNLKEGD